MSGVSKAKRSSSAPAASRHADASASGGAATAMPIGASSNIERTSPGPSRLLRSVSNIPRDLACSAYDGRPIAVSGPKDRRLGPSRAPHEKRMERPRTKIQRRIEARAMTLP